MQEHPVPRQITTFEFKLIGELTLKQFGYLVFGVVIAIILYFISPKILFLNFLLAAIPALVGIGFAFVPINERPMEIWLKNLFKRLTSPTQFYYRKNNSPPKILLGITLPPREVLLQHIQAQQKLNEYLQKKPKTTQENTEQIVDTELVRRKQNIQSLMQNMAYSVSSLASQPTTVQTAGTAVTSAAFSDNKTYTPLTFNTTGKRSVERFSLEGNVFSSSGVPLEGIIIYLKKNGESVRIFKTDKEGHFINNLPLPKEEYILELDDPNKKYEFDRMKIDGSQTKLQIFGNKV